jgi:DNA-binding NtrC family response regulator
MIFTTHITPQPSTVDRSTGAHRHDIHGSDRSHRKKRLCFRALTERLISESKAAEILGISLRDLTRRMDQPSMA